MNAFKVHLWACEVCGARYATQEAAEACCCNRRYEDGTEVEMDKVVKHD